MPIVKIKQFLSNVKDQGTRRALHAILGQMQIEMAKGYRIGPIAGLAVKATADPDLKTTAATYWIKSDGTLQTFSITATIDISGVTGYTPTVQAAATKRIYLITLLDADGTVRVVEGTTVPTASTPTRPPTPAGQVVLGQVLVANTTNPFTFGTTNTDAAGVTCTISELGEVPTSVLA
jgi:hypothetical protein